MIARTLGEIWKRKWLRAMAIVFGLSVGLVVTAVAARPQRAAAQEEVSKAPQTGFEGAASPVVEIRSFAASFSERIQTQEKKNSEVEEKIGAMRGEMEKIRGLIERLGEKKGERTEERTAQETGKEKSGPRLRTIQVGGEKRRSKRVLTVPAGAFANCTLLTGIYAPTTGEPLPALLRVDEVAIGPNRSRVKIKGAFLIGKAQGDANSKRAIVQIATLSVVGENGEAVEAAVNGYVAGEDGVQGAAGEYVYRIGEIATMSGAAAGLQGAAETFASANSARTMGPLGGVTSVLTGDAGEAAGMSAAAKAMSKISEVFSKRLEEIVPAIYVPNGRKVTAVILSSVELERFVEGEVGNDRETLFGGLDAHR